jgi:hypothetical protein
MKSNCSICDDKPKRCADCIMPNTTLPELREIALAISAHLPEMWGINHLYDDSQWQVCLQCTSHHYGFNLSFSQTRSTENKLAVSAWLNDEYSKELRNYGDQDNYTTEINISFSKSPERIAHDIVSRLITPLAPYVTILHERYNKRLAWQSSTRSSVNAICERFPKVQKPKEEDMKETVDIYLTCIEDAYKVNVSGDRITFDRLTTSLDKTLRILAILAEK